MMFIIYSQCCLVDGENVYCWNNSSEHGEKDGLSLCGFQYGVNT